MSHRPIWKGYLKLSLVSCPIALYPAVDASERISFRQVNRATGNRVRHQLVDSITGDLVEAHEKARGYEVGEKQFVLVEEEELEEARAEARAKPFGAAVAKHIDVPPKQEVSKRQAQKSPEEQAEIVAPRPRIENTRTIDIERFIPRSQIDPRYHLTPYYIAPRDVMGEEAFAVIRDALAGRDVVAMGHIVLSNRDRPIVLEPLGMGLRGMTLRYAHEIRREAEYFADIPKMKLPAQMVNLAEHIVDKMLADFDPALLEDRYRTVLAAKLGEKSTQVPQRVDATVPSRANVVNLMEILQRSLAGGQPQKVQRKERAARRAAASSPSPTKRTKVRDRSNS